MGAERNYVALGAWLTGFFRPAKAIFVPFTYFFGAKRNSCTREGGIVTRGANGV